MMKSVLCSSNAFLVRRQKNGSCHAKAIMKYSTATSIRWPTVRPASDCWKRARAACFIFSNTSRRQSACADGHRAWKHWNVPEHVTWRERGTDPFSTACVAAGNKGAPEDRQAVGDLRSRKSRKDGVRLAHKN